MSNIEDLKKEELINLQAEEVPLEDAYELEKLISDSAVIEYPGCSHYAYLENLGQTVNIIKNFIGG